MKPVEPDTGPPTPPDALTQRPRTLGPSVRAAIEARAASVEPRVPARRLIEIGFAEEREQPALALNLGAYTRGSAGEPEIRLELARAERPPRGAEPFAPFRLPSELTVHLSDIDFGLLQRLTADFVVRLRPGRHSIPLAEGRPLQIEYGQAAEARATLDVAEEREEGHDPAVLLRRLNVAFPKPIVIHNVLHVLAEVHTLFEDRTVGPLLQSGPAREAWRRLRALLPERVQNLGGWFEESDSIGVVLLERIQARPRFRRRTQTWELRVSFCGSIRLAGGMVRPFSDVELPNVILPTPHAVLDQLFSASPLVSADVTVDKAPALALLRALLGSLDTGQGSFALSARLPRLRLQTTLIDGTEAELVGRPSDEVTVAGPVQVTFGQRESEVRLDGLSLRFPQEGISLDAGLTLGYDLEASAPKKLWDRLDGSLALAIREGSRIPALPLVLGFTHPLTTRRSSVPLRLSDVEVDGSGALSVVGGALALKPTTRHIRFAGAVATDGAAESVGAFSRARTELGDGRFEGRIELDPGGIWRFGLSSSVSFGYHLQRALQAVPEFMIEDGDLTATVRGQARLELQVEVSLPSPNAAKADLRGTSLAFALDQADVAIGPRLVCLPRDTEVVARVRKAPLSPAGLGPTVVDLRWDLRGAPCLLRAGRREVSLLARGLRTGALTVKLQGGRGLEFAGSERGFFGVRFWKALLDPTAHLETWLDVLRSEDAQRRFIGALEVFAPELGEFLADLRQMGLSVRAILAREGMREPKDLIPRQRLVRFLSLLLAGNEALEARLEPIVRDVTEGRGLAVREMKLLLWEQLEDLSYDYEIDWIVRSLQLLLSPTEPVVREAIQEAPALAEDPRYRDARQGLPAAAHIYRWVAEGRITRQREAELVRLLPYLSLAQLDWLAHTGAERFAEPARAEIRFAYELKRRVQRLSDAYGGVRFAVQTSWVAALLGEALAVGVRGGVPGRAPLGPEEVATLLQVGLATGRQGAATQCNNRLLLDYLRQRPRAFTIEVLVELGNQNPRALTGALFAFLDQDQDDLREPMELSAFLEERLGLPVPRKADYLAGGVRARESYTAALDALSAAILARSEPYLSAKAHLQTVRHRPRGVPTLTAPSLQARATQAQAAIASARRAAAECRFAKTPKGARAAAAEARRQAEATALYEAAFEDCRALLAEEPRAVLLPWLSRFWAENEEALVVHSVVTNYEEDLDRVRFWLHRRLVERKREGFDEAHEARLMERALGYPPLEDRQALVDAVIDVLYAAARDRTALKRAPLVRLLVPPPAGRYDFTIVSAMGVITEGARGRELEEAYRRLWERRRVRVLRADTATGRSLEYNAQRLIDMVRQARTPWGYIGYSQGCANGLMAEGLLKAGTPPEQRLLDRFVARKLLYSAANGSVHGTSGARKVARALVQVERALKPYQATFSRPATETFYRAVRALMDSRAFVQAMGGWHSLTFERAHALHRDLQVVEHAVTSTNRGACEPPFVPEALEYMYALLTLLQPGAAHDTQVVVDDARGQATSVANEWTRALARLDTGSRVENIHHWSPLSFETKFVTTAQDRMRGVYDGPRIGTSSRGSRSTRGSAGFRCSTFRPRGEIERGARRGRASALAVSPPADLLGAASGPAIARGVPPGGWRGRASARPERRVEPRAARPRGAVATRRAGARAVRPKSPAWGRCGAGRRRRRRRGHGRGARRAQG
jgi:hypothetical protein